MNISVFPARDTKDTKIMLWPGTNLNVNANAANPEECLEFISYVTGSEGSSAWLEAPAALKSLWPSFPTRKPGRSISLSWKPMPTPSP